MANRASSQKRHRPIRGAWCQYLVQRSDVVDLYIAALERATAVSFYFVENGEASFAQIAKAIAPAIGTLGL